jgi:DNA-binding CsgD family transcriptional regulator
MKGIKGAKNKLTRLTDELTSNLPVMTEPAAQPVLSQAQVDPWSGLTEFQKRIQTLKLRGIGQRQMAAALSCSEATIAAELGKIREVHRKKGAQIDTEEYVGETLSVYEELASSGWQGFTRVEMDEDNPASHQLKLQFLTFIASMTTAKTKMLMDLGLLRKAKIEVEHSLAPEALEKKLQQEKEQAEFEAKLQSMDKNKLATLILSAGLAPLQDPTPDAVDAELEDV